MSTALVSVVMPAYNAEKYIRGAVASVLSDHITEVLSGSSLTSDPNPPYHAALEKLTVESWRRDYGVASPSRRAKSPRKSPHR